VPQAPGEAEDTADLAGRSGGKGRGSRRRAAETSSSAA
jgi:hypothetical protein